MRSQPVRRKPTAPSKRTISRPVSIAMLRRALERRDAHALTELYTDSAELRIIDRDNPPSRPRELKGKAAIEAYYNDISSREMSHHVDQGVEGKNRLAFTEACEYPDGTHVLSANVLDLRRGKIAKHVMVQAWDA